MPKIKKMNNEEMLADEIEKLKKDIEIAEKIAEEAHKGQFRNDGKTPFIEHPRAVAGSLYHHDSIIVGWLHDVVEDTDITFGNLLDQGISFHLVIVIEALTKRKDENYIDYIKRVKQNDIATRVKIADLQHNILTSTNKHQIEKYQLARYILEKEN